MNIQKDLKNEQVTHLNLSRFCQTESGTPVRQVLNLMRTTGRGTCLILKGGRLVGIFTERDVLTKVVGLADVLNKAIDEIMTSNPKVITPQLSAAAALTLMDSEHFRNLPVVNEDGQIVGDMTYQAIIDYLAGLYPVEVLNRPPDPERFPRKPEGGD
ncbi:MAG: CBS domain-containing protein [Ardenticatenaceae bacterium]|nr:CBS domain-containing protein [Ardenticatenaceae bacterium]